MVNKGLEKIYERYIEHCNNGDSVNSIDIMEHLPILREYGEKCDTIVEMGVRWGSSTIALLRSNPKKMVSYDIRSTIQMKEIESMIKEAGIDHKFIINDVLKVKIDETDLLFIDTLHTYDQLMNELTLHSGKVNKYIILHDTVTFGRRNERSTLSEKIGIRTAMEDFVNEDKKWIVEKDYPNNNGLTILARR